MYYKYFVLTLSLVICTPSSSNEIITLFIKPYPLTIGDSHTTDVLNHISQGGIAHYTAHGIIQKNIVAGMFATYAGYLAISDNSGQIAFPRQHIEPLIYLIITPTIVPVFMLGATIHHWEFVKNKPTEMYKIERIEDTQTGLYYWDTQRVTLPANNRVPLESLVIFANPQSVYVPTGITLTDKRANLVLPNIYLKDEHRIDLQIDAAVLAVRQFFGPIQHMYKTMDAGYSVHVD